MKLQFNKKTAQFLSVLYIVLIIFGTSAFMFSIAGINNITVTDLMVQKIILLNLKISLSFLSPLIIGIWFCFNAEKLNQDKWTWVLIGLVGGQYSLVLFLLSIFFQKDENKQDLFKLFLNIVALLIIASCIDFIPTTWWKPAPELLLNYTLINKSLVAVSSFMFVKLAYMAGLNIYFAFKIYSLLNEYNIKNKPVWVISTLVTGLFPVILVHNLLILEKEKEVRIDSHLVLK